MLMVAILTWGKDLIFQPAHSIEEVHDLKRRLDLKDTDYIIHDSNFLCPIVMDMATREIDESEQIEWLHTTVYPALVAEGIMEKNKKGKYVLVAVREG